MKKMFAINTKTIVATGLGAALFTLLFMFVKVPTGVPEVSLQTAYGVGGFFAALFGPIAALLTKWTALLCEGGKCYLRKHSKSSQHFHFFLTNVPNGCII